MGQPDLRRCGGGQDAGLHERQAAPWDKQTFGAAVVSKTLDYMNSPGLGSTGGSGSARSTGWSGSMSADYDFQKSVLGPAYSGAGALVDIYA